VGWDLCISDSPQPTPPGAGAGDTLLAYPHAGHGVAHALPGAPPSPDPRLAGDGPTANEDAQEQLWPRLLAYLDHLPA
jgi:hypothetical protein